MVEKKKTDNFGKDEDDFDITIPKMEDDEIKDIGADIIDKTALKEEVLASKKDEFDWDAYEGGRTRYAKDQQAQMETLYSNTFSDVKEKEVIMGKVAAITDKDVVLNIGFKSDGLVPLSEFKHMPGLKVGDEVEVIIEEKEDQNGQMIISHKKAQAERAWGVVMDAYEKETIVQGYIKDRTKGGMVVDFMGLDAFLPGSQLDIRPIKDYDEYVGKTIDLKVVKVNTQYRNIVVSHKAIIESSLEVQKLEILGKLEKGQILEGVIKNLTNFGVFVDLGGVDGLIHITDVSWGRINHPEEILEVGQKINIVVLDYDEEKKRISLGMKQLTPHPWESMSADIADGSIIKGKVVNIEDYGAFVEIAAGVEGLIHVSEMSWSTHLKSPNEYLKVGDEVQAKVLNIDREERKLSLGMKQLTKDPWEDVETKYPVGSRHHATVRSLTGFGLFVELEEGFDGLVHISDLSWIKKYNHPAEFTKVGEKLDVVILDIDKTNRRLSLGHKQLEEDPWDTFSSIFLEGTIHQGVVHHFDDKGAVVGLMYGVEAFVPKKHLLKADKSKLKVDETLDFKVLEFDKNNKKIILSHTDIWKEAERAANDVNYAENQKAAEREKKDISKVNTGVEKTTIGDELDVLTQLKSKMEQQDKVKQKEAIAKMDSMQKKADEEVAPVAEVVAPAADEIATEEKPKKATKAKKVEDEAPATEVSVEEKPKKATKAKKVEDEAPATEASVEEKPKKKAAAKTKKEE
ncbi:MAG: 30S ribosomal protein S1 [Bacteroidetes bacterium]|nr:30S ribosomal protein S1 [Bacteroidota bacterium]